MKKLLFLLSLCTVTGPAWADLSREVSLVLTKPMLEDYNPRRDWVLRAESASVRWQGGRWVEHSGQEIEMHVPALSLSVEQVRAVLFQKDPTRTYALRVSGRLKFSNVQNVTHPLALVGRRPVGKLIFREEPNYPLFHFGPDVRVEVIEAGTAVELDQVPEVASSDMQSPTYAEPSQKRPSAEADLESRMTILTHSPKLRGVEAGYMILEGSRGEIAMGQAPSAEFSPESYLSSTETPQEHLKGLRFWVPATKSNVDAFFGVFLQNIRVEGLLVRGLPTTGNVKEILPMPGPNGLRSFFVTVEGQPPEFGFAPDVRVQPAPSRSWAEAKDPLACEMALQGQPKPARRGPVLVIDNVKRK